MDSYKGMTGVMGIPEEKIERDGRNVWSNNDWEFPPINVRHESTDPGSSENTEQDKSPPHNHIQTSESQR